MPKPVIKMQDLRPGDKVRLLFHGSSQLGNEPYEMDEVFRGFRHELTEQTVYAEFEGGWSAYRIAERGSWRYGSSAERLSIVSVTH